MEQQLPPQESPEAGWRYKAGFFGLPDSDCLASPRTRHHPPAEPTSPSCLATAADGPGSRTSRAQVYTLAPSVRHDPDLFAFSDHIHPSLASFPPNTRPASSVPAPSPNMDLLSTSDSNSVRGFSGGADTSTWLQDSLSAVDAWPERAEWRVLVFQIHKLIHMASLSPSLFACHPGHGDASSPNLDHPTAPLLRCAFQRSLFSLLLLISHLLFFLLTCPYRLLHDLSVYVHSDGKHDSDVVRRSALLDYRHRLELGLAPLVREHISFHSSTHL